MLIGKVVGTVVASRKEEKLEGVKLLVLKQVNVEGVVGAGYVVAVDAVGAGLDEYVLYASGSSARQTVVTDKRPVDAVVMAIIDQWEVGGEVKYRKVES
ncbi:MAG: EutN/CcmL family microcompartment protein [Anaerolineae bacterium]|nr:EutN/CcmL family microcompartment protein [Anaerolineae bacterium]